MVNSDLTTFEKQVILSIAELQAAEPTWEYLWPAVETLRGGKVDPNRLLEVLEGLEKRKLITSAHGNPFVIYTVTPLGMEAK